MFERVDEKNEKYRKLREIEVKFKYKYKYKYKYNCLDIN